MGSSGSSRRMSLATSKAVVCSPLRLNPCQHTQHDHCQTEGIMLNPACYEICRFAITAPYGD